MTDTDQRLQHVQGLMVFLAAMAEGLEEVLGRGAGAITYRAGRSTGRQTPVEAREPDDVLRALDQVWEEMCRLGMRWHFRPHLPAGQEGLLRQEDGKTKLELVFDNCMVRCSLFRYGHPQRLSLCLMNHGLFCGLFEQIHGGHANLDILHAGENACLKVLTVEK
jgi:hypothetical protein